MNEQQTFEKWYLASVGSHTNLPSYTPRQLAQFAWEASLKIANENTHTEELKKDLEVTEKLLSERQRVLDAIPECKIHGKCIPHALEWIEEAKETINKLQTFTNDDLTFLYNAARKATKGNWIQVGAVVENDNDNLKDICDCRPHANENWKDAENDSAFIAAANPKVVLELIREIRLLRER